MDQIANWWEFTRLLRSSWVLAVLSEAIRDRDCTIERHVSYNTDFERLKLDVYRPLSIASNNPIALFLYGGGWDSGERSYYSFVGSALAGRGITTVIPDYRLYPEVRFPTFIEDVASAYVWTCNNLLPSAHSKFGPVIIGHSAGAHIGAMLAYQKSYLLAEAPLAPGPLGFVGISGPYSFDFTSWPSTKDIFVKAKPACVSRPVKQVDHKGPPALLIYGAKDPVVSASDAAEMEEAIRSSGAQVKIYCLDNNAHVDTVLMFAKMLRGKGTLLNKVSEFCLFHHNRVAASASLPHSPNAFYRA